MITKYKCEVNNSGRFIIVENYQNHDGSDFWKLPEAFATKRGIISNKFETIEDIAEELGISLTVEEAV